VVPNDDRRFADKPQERSFSPQPPLAAQWMRLICVQDECQIRRRGDAIGGEAFGETLEVIRQRRLAAKVRSCRSSACEAHHTTDFFFIACTVQRDRRVAGWFRAV
jgi:hypothetical protein